MNIFEILIKVREILVSQWPTMLFVIVFLLILIISYKLRKKPAYGYPLRDCVMTPTEFRFFITLLMVVGNRYHVFPQIHFDRILNYECFGKKEKFKAFHHINQKSVDFVLCDLLYATPLVVIELDDWRHEEWENVKKQDKEKEQLFKEAGLPLLRVRVSKDYDREELAKEIENKILNKK